MTVTVASGGAGLVEALAAHLSEEHPGDPLESSLVEGEAGEPASAQCAGKLGAQLRKQ